MNNNNYDARHKEILLDRAKLIEDLQILFYENSNEKSVLRQKLNQILQNRQYEHAIDLGAGPGLVSDVLQQHSKKLTLLEIIPDYYPVLKKAFPNANIQIGSILDFQFTTQYDLMLISYVLYYIATEEWETILKKLYAHLSSGGTLIIIHSPCHAHHEIFHETLSKHKTIAYMDADGIDSLMNGIGPHTKDYYRSLNYYVGQPNHAFAKKYTRDFFGITDDNVFANIHDEFDKLLNLFYLVDGKLRFEYHNDIYIFQKP